MKDPKMGRRRSLEIAEYEVGALVIETICIILLFSRRSPEGLCISLQTEALCKGIQTNVLSPKAGLSFRFIKIDAPRAKFRILKEKS